MKPKKKYNSTNYVKLTPERKGLRTNVNIDSYTQENIESVTAILEQFHGLHYSRDLLIRRAVLNYCHWIKALVKRGKQTAAKEDAKKAASIHRKLDREQDVLVKISGREYAELQFK